MRRGNSPQLFIGIAIIAVGLVLLLNNLNIFDGDLIWRFVPSLFILLGVYVLVVNKFRNWLGPAIVIFLAAIFQLAALDVVSMDNFWQFLWPVILIVVGVRFLLGRNIFQGMDSATEEDTSYVRSLNMFSGTQRRLTSREFEGGEVTAMFGGAEIDLSAAQVSDPPAELNVTAMFGGVEVRVPSDWVVDNSVMAIFGGSGDDRNDPPLVDNDTPANLKISGLAMFGGISLKD